MFSFGIVLAEPAMPGNYLLVHRQPVDASPWQSLRMIKDSDPQSDSK